MAKKPSGFRVGNVQYGRFSGVNPRRVANENATVRERVDKLKSLTAETDRMLKADKSYKLNSGKAAYGPKPPAGPSMGAKIAGTVARGVLRAAGPVGALVGMTTPAGLGSDKPSGPLMRGNSKPTGKTSRGGSKEGQSSRVPTSRGGSKGGGSISGGQMSPSSAPSSKSRSYGGGKMGSSSSQSGGKSAPSKSSKSNLGTSRF